MSATTTKRTAAKSVSKKKAESAKSAEPRLTEPKVIRRTVGKAARPAPTPSPEVARRQRVVVVAGVIAMLTVAGVLLLILQPAPLAPDAVRSLMSLESAANVDSLFETQVPSRANRWKYIYVHHSGSPTGNASALKDRPDPSAPTLPDHFVIGNGEGAADGEIQVGRRWNLQQVAGRTPGLDRVDPDCISICLIGDFDQSTPTSRQMAQLNRLVNSLQNKLQIGRERVWVVDSIGSPAGCGRLFPKAAFHGNLLP